MAYGAIKGEDAAARMTVAHGLVIVSDSACCQVQLTGGLKLLLHMRLRIGVVVMV